MSPRRGRPTGSGVVWPSAKAIYALRACGALAAAPSGERLKAAEIARRSKVPVRFLSKILGELRDRGIVDAQRGYYGGYMLTRPPVEITIADVMIAAGSYELFVAVATDPADRVSAWADDAQARLRALAAELAEVTIADLAVATGALVHDPDGSPALELPSADNV